MTDRVNGGVCRSSASPMSLPGAPCSNCGHTNLVHSGIHNPTIGECVLCVLEDAIAQFIPPPGVTLTIERVEGEKGERSP